MDRTAESPAKLVLVECPALGREVVAGIEIGIAQEFENVAMQGIGPGLCDDVDLASAELTIFGVKVIGENAELGDRVQIGDDGGAHVDILFDIAPIHQEAVGKFALAVDGDGARIQIAGGRKHARPHILHGVGGDGGDGSDAGLEGEQVGETSSIERHACHLFAGDDLPDLGAGGLNVQLVFGDRDHVAF